MGVVRISHDNQGYDRVISHFPCEPPTLFDIDML